MAEFSGTFKRLSQVENYRQSWQRSLGFDALGEVCKKQARLDGDRPLHGQFGSWRFTSLSHSRIVRSKSK